VASFPYFAYFCCKSLKDATILCHKFISINFLVAAERSEAVLGLLPFGAWPGYLDSLERECVKVNQYDPRHAKKPRPDPKK
jgi:hypothetical protein